MNSGGDLSALASHSFKWGMTPNVTACHRGVGGWKKLGSKSSNVTKWTNCAKDMFIMRKNLNNQTINCGF